MRVMSVKLSFYNDTYFSVKLQPTLNVPVNFVSKSSTCQFYDAATHPVLFSVYNCICWYSCKIIQKVKHQTFTYIFCKNSYPTSGEFTFIGSE